MKRKFIKSTKILLTLALSLLMTTTSTTKIFANLDEKVNVFGQVTADFQPTDEIKGIPSGRIMDTALLDLINKIQLEAAAAEVSTAQLFHDNANLLLGDINYDDIFDICKFDNKLLRVNVTGAELKNYMEWTTRHFNKWQAGDINISFNSEYPGNLYDMFAGVEYKIDLSKAVGERIVNVKYKEEPLQDDEIISLVVNSHIYENILKEYGLISENFNWESSHTLGEIIMNYFEENSPITPQVNGNWSIIGIDLEEQNPYREIIVELINNGQLQTPYDKSYNLYSDEVKMILEGVNNIKIGDKYDTIDVFVSSSGISYYRLRDIAMATRGTDRQFNIGWQGQIVIEHGEEYNEEPLPLHLEGHVEWHELMINVAGQNVNVFGAYAIETGKKSGHYYFDEENLEKILNYEIETWDKSENGNLIIEIK